MVKYSFVFLIMFTIGELSFFLQDAATSVVPGWHTTVYPPWFLVTLFSIIWLGIASLIYYVVERNRKVVPKTFFQLHTILSLFAFTGNVIVYFDSYYLTKALSIAPYFLFAVGQVIFLIGVLKAKKRSIIVTE